MDGGRMSATLAPSSNIARKFEFLQDRAQRRPITQAPMGALGMATSASDAAAKKANITNLKEFYLNRLSQNEPQTAARLGAGLNASIKSSLGAGASVDMIDHGQPKASGQRAAQRPAYGGGGGAPKDIEDLEIMCNNCFNLIKSAEMANCNGDCDTCPVAARAGGHAGAAGAARPAGQIAVLDAKLSKLRAALESRLQDQSLKVNVMRHLTQLRYHIDIAAKWGPSCAEIGALSAHTVQQVKQLTVTSRTLAPAVYIFSKRIENVVVQKERELRKIAVESNAPSSMMTGGMSLANTTGGIAGIVVERGDKAESLADLDSVVEDCSDTGTRYEETVLTCDQSDQKPGTSDVADVNAANEVLSLKNEDEQRRWFYSQCLAVKLACPDKTRARRTLISDLYSRVRSENVPTQQWGQWIRLQLMPDEDGAATDGTSTGVQSASGPGDSLAATMPVGAAMSRMAAPFPGAGGYPFRGAPPPVARR